MKLRDARALQHEIQCRGYHCIVPLGFGPACYFARIFGVKAAIDFHSVASFRKHHAKHLRERRRIMRTPFPARPRSPIEVLVDRACGLDGSSDRRKEVKRGW